MIAKHINIMIVAYECNKRGMKTKYLKNSGIFSIKAKDGKVVRLQTVILYSKEYGMKIPCIKYKEIIEALDDLIATIKEELKVLT